MDLPTHWSIVPNIGPVWQAGKRELICNENPAKSKEFLEALVDSVQ